MGIPNFKFSAFAKASADKQFSILGHSISLKQVVKHPLFSGSAVMIIGSNFGNFLAYLYHVVMGRILGPGPYGELASFIAIIGLFSVTFSFLGTVIVKFVSSANEDERNALYSFFLKKGVTVGISIGFVLLIISLPISQFLHLDIKTALLIGPTLAFFFFSLLFRSFLHGLMKFTKVVILANFDLIFRFIFGLAFVYLGYSAFGASFGIFLGAFASLVLGAFFIKGALKYNKNEVFQDGKRIFKYSLPVLIYSVASNSFLSADLLLAKHYFSPHTAGIYASLSTLGKIIFYGAAPVSGVMFPLIAQRHAKGNSYKKILLMSIFITLIIAAIINTVYYFYPELMVTILYGQKFIEAAPYLVWFGLFIGVFTLVNLFASYYLSVEKTKIVFWMPIFAGLQIAGIIIKHDTILDLIQVSLVSVSLFLVGLLIYYIYENKISK